MTTSSAAEVMIRPERCRPRDDRHVVVAAGVVLLLDPRQQEHLVVHGQPEAERQHQRRDGRLDPPVEVNPSRPSRWPSWKIRTSTPSDAPSDTTFISSALSGTSTEPVMQEQQHERGQHDDAGGHGARPADRRGVVDLARGLPDDPGREVGPVATAGARTTRVGRLAGVVAVHVHAEHDQSVADLPGGGPPRRRPAPPRPGSPRRCTCASVGARGDRHVGVGDQPGTAGASCSKNVRWSAPSGSSSVPDDVMRSDEARAPRAASRAAVTASATSHGWRCTRPASRENTPTGGATSPSRASSAAARAPASAARAGPAGCPPGRAGPARTSGRPAARRPRR